MLSALSYIVLATIRLGTPIAITAMGATISERTGILNIGLEGIMSMGAFLAVLGSYWTGNPWFGVLLAVLVGVVISAIHGFVSIVCGGAQGVSSQALVLLATGFCSVGLQAIFGQKGMSPTVNTIATTEFLRPIPLVGNILADFSPIVYIALILLFVCNFVLFKTPLGLRMCACGEHPRAAETAGINVGAMRFLGVLISGFLGGLAGAFLSVGQMNLFQEGMVAGRGYLAMGAIIMGRWTPTGAFAAAMCFGFFDAVQLYIQIIPNSPIPHEFVQMVPYVASLIVLALTIKGATGPAASGQPYSKISGTR
ncbi:ABC transporter permease [Bittarella sp. HCP28S3_D9]|uniref:ABC transporter permease n=1 Tax=Bittarella sp. HCP28S3_D9 TaxID=3440253 RepID=UPI003F88C69A